VIIPALSQETEVFEEFKESERYKEDSSKNNKIISPKIQIRI
jgi:hypothetical protein